MSDELSAALDRIALALREVDRLQDAHYKGDRDGWRISIPARPNRDSDLILSDALTWAQSKLLAIAARIAVLEAELARVRAQMEERETPFNKATAILVGKMYGHPVTAPEGAKP